MKSARRYSREFALRALYQWQLSGATASEIESQLAEDDRFPRADRELYSQIVTGVIAHADELKGVIAPALDRRIEELAPIERAILLIGTYELVHCPETPYRVIVNEGIELAKVYGGTDGHKYVNAVLDKLARQLRANERPKA